MPRSYADTIGRDDPLSVVFIPDGLSMGAEGGLDADRVIASIRELEAIGVDWVSVALPGDTRDARLMPSTVRDRCAGPGVRPPEPVTVARASGWHGWACDPSVTGYAACGAPGSLVGTGRT